MTWISATDPLALVAIQAGQVPTPQSERGAAADSKLDTQQVAMQIGEPVPIVFARRRNNKGGIFISPKATEARFENSASNEVRAYYHLVVSEGQIDSIAVKDVFQRACRVGTHTQTYNRRAGTWTPENDIVQRTGYTLPEAPYYCGTVGAYPRMTTLSFRSGYIPDGFDQWNRQVHLFIRGGMHVLRFEDDVEGASDSFADLTRWLLSNSGRVPDDLIDLDALEDADLFLRVNGFTCNCYLTQSRNLVDFLSEWGPYFLLGQSNNNGKKGLRPILPVTAAGAIDTGIITPAYAFTEESILPGSFEIQYVSLADRQPFVAQMTWRQELGDDFGIIRTAEVRIAGTAEVGPYESHDLSEFCTNEAHAVKVGAYLVAKRYYTTHTVRFAVKPGDHTSLLTPGDIIRVRMLRRATGSQLGYHDYLYQVERITKTLAGDVSYECTHFPVDNEGRSLIAQSVNQATGSGILLASIKTGVSCDVNSSSDNTVPAEEFTEPVYTEDTNPYDTDIPGFDEGLQDNGSLASGGEGSGGDGATPGDSIGPYQGGAGGGGGDAGETGEPEIGDTLSTGATVGDGCAYTVAWYSVDPQTGATILRKSKTITGSGQINETNYTVAQEDEGLQIFSTSFKTCLNDPEPEATQTDYGKVKPTSPAKVYKYFRFNGTQTARGKGTSTLQTSWYATEWYYGAIQNKDSILDWGTSAESKVTDFVTPPGCVVTYSPYPIIRTKGLVATTVFSQVGVRADGCYGEPIYGSDNSLKSIKGKWEFSDDKSTIAATIG